MTRCRHRNLCDYTLLNKIKTKIIFRLEESKSLYRVKRLKLKND